MSTALREATRIADDVLFPAALEVDAADRVPESHLLLLAEKGFYGLAAPEPFATLDLPDYAAVQRVVETLAGGCLTTALVWVQHHGAVMATATTENHTLRDEYLPALASGKRRAGLAAGAAVKPGTPLLRATPTDGGWLFDGEAPWVTGWDMVDTLHTAGRAEGDMLVWAMLDAQECDTLTVTQPDMVALRASRTVTVRFTGHFVAHERVTSTMPLAKHHEGDPESVRFTGSLALGVAGRAISLMGNDHLAAQLDATRTKLTQAVPEDIPGARAVTSELALRAAAALAVHDGSRSVLLREHAQRLVREAAFLLVFGSRPGIRTALLDRLTHNAP